MESANRLKNMADEVGRDINSLSISVFGAPPKPEVLDTYRKAGIDRALFALPSEDKDTVFKTLDKFQCLLD